MKVFLLLGLLLIGTAVECRDRNGNAQEIDKSEARVVAYGKALDVAKLDPALPSQRFDDWLSSGPPKIGSLEWSSGCDLKLEGPEPRDGWPLCVKARLRRHDLWGWVLVTIGTTRSGIHGEPRVTHIVMTSKALAMKGQFRNAETLSELPRLIEEVEDAHKALGKDK